MSLSSPSKALPSLQRPLPIKREKNLRSCKIASLKSSPRSMLSKQTWPKLKQKKKLWSPKLQASNSH